MPTIETKYCRSQQPVKTSFWPRKWWTVGRHHERTSHFHVVPRKIKILQLLVHAIMKDVKTKINIYFWVKWQTWTESHHHCTDCQIWVETLQSTVKPEKWWSQVGDKNGRGRRGYRHVAKNPRSENDLLKRESVSKRNHQDPFKSKTTWSRDGAKWMEACLL